MQPRESRKKWPLLACAGLLLGLAPALAVAQGGARLDRSLRQRLGAMPPTALVNVIVTVQAGTKPAVCRVLVASGATITSEFSLIEGFGATLSAEAVQSLARDARVVAISSDGAVDAKTALGQGPVSEGDSGATIRCAPADTPTSEDPDVTQTRD